MIKRMLALVLIVILLMAGVGAVQSAHETSVTGSQDATVVTDETWTVDEGNVTALANSNREHVVYNESVTVTQDGTEYKAEGNYTWYSNNGTVKALNGSGLVDGNTSEIDYRYTEPSQSQQAARSVLTIPTHAISDSLTEILGAALLLATIVVFARMGGK